MERIAEKAGVAAGWLVVAAVVAQLAPVAAGQAKELVTETVASIRARFRRRRAAAEEMPETTPATAIG